ncbi:MAG: 3-methylornithine--L-lysine ligase PylC, partial [Deltaproteobacteria bacterium]|nr:3-methylornithine--L-lysine ligase PylC [Deltaproteobacteria bacterium]
QEYLGGSLHSLEIMGEPGCYRALQVTDLYMDQSFDCKRVVAPTELASDLIADFEELSLTIADAIKLHGIMDVEVVLNQGDFKVLEIDARLPSQTPTTVYWSTGQNLVQMLGEQLPANVKETQSGTKADRGIVYEHIRMSPEILETRGEHIMTEGGPLYLLQDFFGADEAITNFNSRKNRWVATLIISETDRRSALAKKDRVIEEIVKRLSIKKIYDTLP